MNYEKITLDSGLKVITSSMPHTRSVSVLFFILCGSCYEQNEVAGISHFIEHMCFKGTGKRPSSMAISEAIEGVGGIMNGGTDRQLTSYWCKLASQHLDLAVDVITDLLHNPLFRDEDIEKERQVIIEEINMSLDSPQQRVCMIFDELMWLGKPMGRDVAGTKETVSSINRQQMLEMLNNAYNPGNMLVSIVGDIDTQQVQELLNKNMQGWNRGNKPQYLPSDGCMEGPRFKYEHRETEQINLMLGVDGYSMFHPDRHAVDLISMILGEGMSCRLFTEIREKLGLAYDIHSYVEHFRETGAFIVQAGIDPQQTEKTVSAILDELAYMKEGVRENELRRAVEMAKGRLLLSMENSRNVAGWYGAQEALTGEILTVDDVTRIIEGITVDDIKRVAKDIFVSGRLNLAVVGPGDDMSHLQELLKL